MLHGASGLGHSLPGVGAGAEAPSAAGTLQGHLRAMPTGDQHSPSGSLRLATEAMCRQGYCEMRREGKTSILAC
jgi:hypothetical protein